MTSAAGRASRTSSKPRETRTGRCGFRSWLFSLLLASFSYCSHFSCFSSFFLVCLPVKGVVAAPVSSLLAPGCSSEPRQYPRDPSHSPEPIFMPNAVDGLMVWTSNSLLLTTTTSLGYPGGPLMRGPLGSSASSAASWSSLTEELKKAAGDKDVTDSDAGVVAVHQSPVDQDVLFVQGEGRYNWVTTDGGKRFTACPSPGVDRPSLGRNEMIKFHPRQRDWLLMRTSRDACDVSAEARDCRYDLMATKDLGKSWMNLTAQSKGHIDGVRDFEWGLAMSHFYGRKTQDEDIFVTAYPGGERRSAGMYPGWDDHLRFYFSDNLFKSAPKMEVQCGNLFQIISNRLYLAMPSLCPVDPDGNPRHSGSGSMKDRSVTMYVSVKGTRFVEACLPASLEDDGYNLVSTHDDGGVFVLADHAEPGSMGPTSDSPSADAYAPAYNASLHTMSIGDVYRRLYITDFARVEGVPGYLLANQIDRSLSTRMFSFLKTKHSKNGGATWDLIAPPEEYRHTQCNTCAPGSTRESCALHLHGPTSFFAPEGQHPNFYSIKSAPGLVVSTGNVGAHLNFQQDADCTYVSRDGGQTWTDVAPYTAMYEIGPSGGTIVMAKHRSEGPASEVQFSLDQGACFHTIKLSKALLVENIRVGSGDESDTFYVYGSVCSKIEDPLCTFEGGSTAQGIMFVVRLADMVADDWKACDTGASSASYEEYDFGGACLLGRKRTMRRRTAAGDDFCANPSGFKQRVVPKDPCQCTLADVECEFGYIRASDKLCVPMEDFSSVSACPRLAESKYLTSSSHWRLVHGNACSNVNAVIPDTNGKGGGKGTDDTGSDSSGCHHASAMKSFFKLIVSVGATLVIVSVVWSQCMTPEQQEGLLAYISPLASTARAAFEVALGFIVEAYTWVKHKVLSVIGSRSEDREYYEALRDTEGGLEDVSTTT